MLIMAPFDDDDDDDVVLLIMVLFMLMLTLMTQQLAYCDEVEVHVPYSVLKDVDH